MRQCPVCDTKTDTPKCAVCGFDFSRDYEHFPTLAPTMSIAARRKIWQERQQETVSVPPLQQMEAEPEESQEPKLPHEIFRDYCAAFFRRYFDVTENETLTDILRKELCWLLVICIVGYIALDQVHWIFLHTSLAFDDAPCAERGICSIFPCDISDLHDWENKGCLMPRECCVCGAEQGGTSSHLWCDVDGDGTEVCHLCGAELRDPWFYQWKKYNDNLTTSVDTLQFTINCQNAADLPSGPITILDHTGSAFQDYTHAWADDTLTVQFTQTPPEGKYTVYAVVDSESIPIADQYFGRFHIPVPAKTWSPTNFRAAHLLPGLFLDSQNGKRTDGTCSTWQDAAVFSDLTELGSEITCTEYLMKHENKEYCYLYTFEQNEQYLSVDPDGKVCWLDTLTDRCYWLVYWEK